MSFFRPMINLQLMLLSACISFILFPITLVTGHGFLSTPRSRNLVAYEDRKYHGQTEFDPLPEDCPTCINRGGTLARCGVLNPGTGDDRNYDFPKNNFGRAMPSNPQEVYEEGAEIDVEVTLSAHHKGHFVFKACPIPATTVSPTQECFDDHPLLFVEDLLYGAPVDVNHPERVYVAPSHHPDKVLSPKDGFKLSMLFHFKLRLPPGVTGDLVLIQWYYVAGNSGCAHEGYEEYPWPEDWIWNMNEDEEISDWEQKVSVGAGLKNCQDLGAIPPDGNGVPEQFWNCAEVSIYPPNSPELGETATMSFPEGDYVSPNTNPGQLQSSKTIIAYWASWQWYDRLKFAEPWVFDYRKYTRVNFAFFQTNEQGDLWGTDAWADPNTLFGPYNWNGAEGDAEYCSWDAPPNVKKCQTHFYEKGIIYLAKKAGAEVWPSIGGWSLSDPFPVMAKNEGSRQRFASQCIELIEEYGFDGIDIDWEYPGYEDHSGTPDDTESYNLLLRDVREKLDELGERTGKFYGLTAALPCGTGHISNIDIPTAAKYLTELNLMTYDFFGTWSPTVGANAPLHDQNWGGEDVKGFSIDGCVKNWIKGGGKPEQINIGLPFYGRGFLKAKGLNETHGGKPDKNTWWQDDGSPQYFNIVNELPNLVSVRHELTSTQYAYNDEIVNGIEVGGIVSYDDEEAICDKTQYTLDFNLNGFIIWEVSGDLMEDLSTPLIDAVHAKLRDPTLDCKEFAYDKNTFQGTATSLAKEIATSLALEISVSDALGGESGPKEKLPECESQWHWGIMSFNQCRSYFNCVNGSPDMATFITCPDSELYDETGQQCKEASQVSCSEVAMPTAPPVGVIQDQGAPEGMHQGMEFEYDPDCPANFMGFMAGPDCSSYFRCVSGQFVPPVLVCQAGTIFDETVSTCNFEGSVECTTTSPPEAVSTPQPTSPPEPVSTLEPTHPPRPISTPQPTRHPTTYRPTNWPTRHPNTDQPTRRPTNDPTRHPIVNDVPKIQNEPIIIPQTPRPTRNPIPKPTPQPIFNSPTMSQYGIIEPDWDIIQLDYEIIQPEYEKIQSKPGLTLVQAVPPTNPPTKERPPTDQPTNPQPPTNGPTNTRPPTNQPTKKPKKPKTPKPTPNNSLDDSTTGGNTMASNFLDNRPTQSYTILAPTESTIVEYHNSPSKGEESLGDKINAQIQQHQGQQQHQNMKMKKKAINKKAKKGGQKKKMGGYNKNNRGSKSRKSSSSSSSSSSSKSRKTGKARKNNNKRQTQKKNGYKVQTTRDKD